MALPRHALATLELYKPEAGGRKGPLLKREYRGDIRMANGPAKYFGFLVDIEEVLHPGEVRTVYLAFTQPDLVAPYAKPGAETLYCEGHPVGRGEILEFYLSDDELATWAL